VKSLRNWREEKVGVDNADHWGGGSGYSNRNWNLYTFRGGSRKTQDQKHLKCVVVDGERQLFTSCLNIPYEKNMSRNKKDVTGLLKGELWNLAEIKLDKFYNRRKISSFQAG